MLIKEKLFYRSITKIKLSFDYKKIKVFRLISNLNKIEIIGVPTIIYENIN